MGIAATLVSVAIGVSESRTDLVPSPGYIPSATVAKFILATSRGPVNQARVLALMGPRGCGKTTGAVAAMVSLAERVTTEHPEIRPLKAACIRDTWISLERTTQESIRDFSRKGLPVFWHSGGREAWIGHPTNPVLRIYFFGLDQEGDADKLQGLELGVLWLEEVAPAAGLSAGVPATALGLGATSLRQPGVPPRILMTLNPPDRDHWVLKVEEFLDDLGLEDILVERYSVPKHEKSDHFEMLAATSASAEERQGWTEAAYAFRRYTERNRAFLASIGRPDLVNRLVEGEIGEIQVGEAVVPAFSRTLHVAAQPLVIHPHWPIVRGHDGGGSPSTVFVQPLGEHGRDGLNILGSHTSVNTPIETHIREWVLPFMSRYGLMPHSRGEYGQARRRVHLYRDIVDPSMIHEGKTVRGTESTSGYVITEMLGAGLEAGPVDWDSRREALNAAFSRAGLGDRLRFIEIDPDENDMLITALAGRFRYPKHLATGRVEMTVEAAKRVSGVYSGTPDALAYVLACLYPAWEWLRKEQRSRAPQGPVRTRGWLGR